MQCLGFNLIDDQTTWADGVINDAADRRCSRGSGLIRTTTGK